MEIQSMTGYGRKEGVFEGKKINVEIKSLNSKQIEVNTRMLNSYREKEILFRKLIVNKLGRGKVDLSIYVENSIEENIPKINQNLAKKYHEELQSLNNFLGENNTQLMSQVLGMPDVMKAEKSAVNAEEWQIVETLINEAVNDLIIFRKDEGAVLCEDIIGRINTIANLLKQIEPYEKERIITVKNRIKNNLKQIEETTSDANRFEQELIFYLEKFDITEEKVRLKKHCDYFFETLEINDVVGKKLGFICQEIGREINTIGSKANHAEIQKMVINMKDELEKVKEQLLNIL